MGSICAIVRRVDSDQVISCEIQNEGWIYENQTIVFERKKTAGRNTGLSPARSPDRMDNNDQANGGNIAMLATEINDELDDDDSATHKEDIHFILQNDVDYVIASINSSHHEILELKE